MHINPSSVCQTPHKNHIISHFKFDSISQSTVCADKIWEPHIQNFVKLYHSFFNIKHIADVGANFGYHTLFFSDVVSREGKVYAFEPQPQNFYLLKENIHNNNIQNVILYDWACGEIEADVNIAIFKDTQDYFNMGDFSCYDNVDNNSEYVKVKSKSIDSCNIKHLDLIKMDVQGWEVRALQGALKTIQTCKPTIIVEFEYWQLGRANTTCEELAQLLRDMNYYIFYLEAEYPADHVCVHKDNLENFICKFEKFIYPHTESNSINYNTTYGVDKKISVI